MRDDLVDRLRLVRSPGIGPVTYRHLIARFGSAVAALEAVPDLAARGGGKPPRLASQADAEREIARVEAEIGLTDRLLDCADLPLVPDLHRDGAGVGRGDGGDLVDRHTRAVHVDDHRVEQMRAGAAGAQPAELFLQGIDSAAHDGSLETGTVGVIAGGLDVFYPPENQSRQEAMSERGLVIAEMPPGTEPRARHFPYRNRIIAGLSAGTVVVEAAPRSGSLITARLAAESGREVMAVPGSPLDPRAQGCNQLIRDGATLIQNASDVLEAVRPLQPRFASPRSDYQQSEASGVNANGDALSVVEELLGPSPVPVDEVIRLSGAPSGAVQMALLELDLAGRLDRHAGGKVSLRPAT